MRDPIKDLPLFIGQIIEFNTSMRRIQEFLLLEEVNQTLIDDTGSKSSSNSEPAFEIEEKSYFFWGQKELNGDSQAI